MIFFPSISSPIWYVESPVQITKNINLCIYVPKEPTGFSVRALETRVEVGAPGCQGPQVTCLSHCSSISQLANSPIFSPLLSPGPASPLPLASLPMAWPPREPTTRSSPEGSEGREELGAPASPSPPPHQVRKGRASPPDSDEGIESEEGEVGA